MKHSNIIIIVVFYILTPIFLIGQSKHDQKEENDKREYKIDNIEFDKNKIYLEGNLCFNYLLNNGEFAIMDLNSKNIITGKITSLENGNFTSLINFVIIDKKFHNDKIIGRNDIIFALIENFVIDRNCNIDIEKLIKFVEENNQLK